MSDLSGVPPEAIEAVARTLWRFQTSETWEERERQFPDSTDLMRTRDKARIILAAAAPHLQRHWAALIRAEAWELPPDDGAEGYNEGLEQAMEIILGEDVYLPRMVPAPSVQRSSDDD